MPERRERLSTHFTEVSVSQIQEALEAARAALVARPRLVVKLDELNQVQADFSPYAVELAMIERALCSMVLLERGLSDLLLKPCCPVCMAAAQQGDVPPSGADLLAQKVS